MCGLFALGNLHKDGGVRVERNRRILMRLLPRKNALINIRFEEERVTEYLHSLISADNAVLYAIFSWFWFLLRTLTAVMVIRVTRCARHLTSAFMVRMCGFTLTDSASGAWSCTSVVKVSDKVLEIEFLNFQQRGWRMYFDIHARAPLRAMSCRGMLG